MTTDSEIEIDADTTKNKQAQTTIHLELYRVHCIASPS